MNSSPHESILWFSSKNSKGSLGSSFLSICRASISLCSLLIIPKVEGRRLPTVNRFPCIDRS